MLQHHRLKIKKEKCQFGEQQVQYLGYIISAKGVDMDPSKVEAITSWRLPRTIKDLRGFLGLTGYYRKLKQHYGKIVEPLTALLRKDAFQWTVAASIAF